jgi:hypothetical protein
MGGITAARNAGSTGAARRGGEPTSGTGRAPRAEQIIGIGNVPIVRVANPA